METTQKEAPAVQAEVGDSDTQLRRFIREQVIRQQMRQDMLAFKSGEKSKRFGYQRLSAFYENQRADYFFFAGYDGIGWDRACEGMFQHA